MTSRIPQAHPSALFLPRLAAYVLAVLALSACGGGGGNFTPPTFTIGGAVTGLAANASLVLSDNGTDSLTVTKTGSFTFAQSVKQGDPYSVTVTTQPTGQSCVLSSGSGTATANVTSVQVACSGLPQYAYVVNNTDQTVSQYSVTSSGTLTPLSAAPIATGVSPRSVTVDPTRHYVYVTNLGDNNVSQYVIQKDGTLAANTPATVATGNAPWALEFDPQGKFAYVVNSVDNTISQFSVSSTGVLDLVSVAPVSTGAGPWNITLSPNGKYAYVSNYGTVTAGLNAAPSTVGNTISQYAKAPDTGQHSPLNPATVATGNYPGGSVVDATNSYIYVTSTSDNTVWQYSIGSAGDLTPLTPNTVTAGNEPADVVISPDNKYLYVANFGATSNGTTSPGSVSQYSVGASGQLTPLTTPTVPAGRGAGELSLDSFGQFVYLVNSKDNTISQYSIGSDGSLTSLGTVATGNSPFEIGITYIGP
jgi:6-phosphogluconolactonase